MNCMIKQVLLLDLHEYNRNQQRLFIKKIKFKKVDKRAAYTKFSSTSCFGIDSFLLHILDVTTFLLYLFFISFLFLHSSLQLWESTGLYIVLITVLRRSGCHLQSCHGGSFCLISTDYLLATYYASPLMTASERFDPVSILEEGGWEWRVIQ